MFLAHLGALGFTGSLPIAEGAVDGEEEVDLLAYLVESTEGFSGAECASVCRRAVAVAMGGCGALDDTLREVYGGGGEGCPFSPSPQNSAPTAPQLNFACFVGAIMGDERSGIIPLAAK